MKTNGGVSVAELIVQGRHREYPRTTEAEKLEQAEGNLLQIVQSGSITLLTGEEKMQ